MTFPEVDPPTKLPIVSRQAHERRPHRWIRAHCKEMHQEGKPLGLVPDPRSNRQCVWRCGQVGGTKELLNLPSHHLGAASAAPNSAALSGSIPKAPGSAGGYLPAPLIPNFAKRVPRSDAKFAIGAHPLPKLVTPCGASSTSFGSERGTSNSMILVPLYELKFLMRLRQVG